MPPPLPDAEALRDLERAANLVALAHVFPPDEFPYPDQAVADRWRATLADPTVRVDVVDGPHGLRVFAAYDATTLRHLAVHPDDWGTGLARAAVARATAAIAAGGSRGRCCGAWRRTTGPSGCTATSAGGRPAASVAPSGRPTPSSGSTAWRSDVS